MAPNNPLPIWGNEKTMNLNPLILTNIQSSPYFKVNLYELKTYHEVIDEIYYKVSHLEPWEKGSRKTAGQTGMCGGVRGVGAGGIVSSAFCLLYKLFTLRLTKKQVIGLITHRDSPYIRALGFMYIRFTQPPQDLWDWFEGYLDDEEEIDVKAGGGHSMTIGEMIRHWFTKLEWYCTLFPRIPVPTQKDLGEKLKARALSKAQDGQPIDMLPDICNGDEGIMEETEEWNEEEQTPASVDVNSKSSRSPERRRYDRSGDKSASQSRKSPDKHRGSHSPHRRSPHNRKSPQRKKSPRHRSPPPSHHPSLSSASSSHRKLSPSSSVPSKYSSNYSSSTHQSSMDDFAVELARERERQRRERERDCNGKPKDDHHHHHHKHHHRRRHHHHHHSSSKSKDKETDAGGEKSSSFSVKEKYRSRSRSPNRSRSHEKKNHSKEHKRSKSPSVSSSKAKKRSRSRSVEEKSGGGDYVASKSHKSRSHHKKDHSQDRERREKKSKKKKHDRHKSKENGDNHN